MKPIIRQQKTGYYVTDGDGKSYQDETGHGWFSKTLAREIAKRLGGWYEQGNRTTIKEVVIGYTPETAEEIVRDQLITGRDLTPEEQEKVREAIRGKLIEITAETNEQ